MAFIRQILQNAGKAELFRDVEKDPIESKIPNIEQISKLRWLFEKRNIFDIDDQNYLTTERDAMHIIGGQEIEMSFVNCKLLGTKAMNEFISQIIKCRPSGSFEFIRKRLNIKKNCPISNQKENHFKIQITTNQS